MKTLKHIGAEMALHVLAYNILGSCDLVAAMCALRRAAAAIVAIVDIHERPTSPSGKIVHSRGGLACPRDRCFNGKFGARL